MKNNTKLIMETWRRFLNEEEDPMDRQDSMTGKTPLPGEAPFEEEQPLQGDQDLGTPVDTFDRESQGGGPSGQYIPDEGIVDELMKVLSMNPLATDDDLMERVPEAYPEDIEEARTQHQEEMPGSMQDMHDDLSAQTGGDYDSQSAGLEKASIGKLSSDF